jgi:iron complex outermembrane receptor protein
MRMHTHRLAMFSGAAMAVALGALSATSASAQSNSDAPVIEEVIVTAQKRSENVQKVPIAISVVSGDAMERANINSAEQLIQMAPSLTFRKGNTNKDSALTVRGVGTISFASGVEPSVSTVVDGVVYARSGQATADFLDLERIEILRGPQGTLFGKNASAGVISMITKAPNQNKSGYLDASYYEGNEYRVRGAISGPLSDTLAGSLAGFVSHFDGNGKNVFNGHDINGYEHNGLRGRLRWTPTEDLSVDLIADYSHNVDNGFADSIGTVFSSAFNDNVFTPSLKPLTPGDGNKDIDNDQDPWTKDINSGFSAQVNWSVGEYSLTSITAYRNWKNAQARDGDFRSDAPTYVATGALAGDIRSHDYGRLNFDQFTQEFRIASPVGHFFEYVAGLYYYHTWESNYFTRTVTSCTASTLAPVTLGALGAATPCAKGASTYATNQGIGEFQATLENYAAFGQGTLNFSDRFRGVFGARWTHDTIDFVHRRLRTSGAAALSGVNPTFAGEGGTKAEGWSGKVGAQYDLTPVIMAYGSYTRGYKGPAMNVFFNMQAIDNFGIAPETSDAYEIGLKSRLLEGRLVLNASIFDTTYKNFQANNLDMIGTTVVTRLTNAGTVSTKGFETDFTFEPIKNLRFTGGYAYVDAKIDKFKCPTTGTCTALAINGKPLPYSSKHKLSVNTSYFVPLEGQKFDLDFNVGAQYQSKMGFDINQNPFAIQKGYTTIDASVAFVSKDEKLRLALVGKNLTDEHYVINRIPNGTSFLRQITPRDGERYFGATLRYNFH